MIISFALVVLLISIVVMVSLSLEIGVMDFQVFALSIPIGILLAIALFFNVSIVSSKDIEYEMPVTISRLDSNYLVEYQSEGEPQSIIIKSSDISIKFIDEKNDYERLIVSTSVTESNPFSDLLRLSNEEEVSDKSNSWKIENGDLKSLVIKESSIKNGMTD